MQHGLAHDPKQFLTDLKANGEKWSPMNAARLVMGRRLADNIRGDMGVAWFNVTIASHLSVARDEGEWSFAHSTLQTWLDYQSDRLDEAEYQQRLAEHAEDGKAEYLKLH